MSDATIYICQTCTRTLDTRMDPWGVSQIHTAADGKVDHDPDPVPMPEGWRGGRCDFCFAEPVGFVLPARDFPMPFDANATSGGDWAMCGECAVLVQQNRWTAVTRRAAESYIARHGPIPPEGVRRIHTQIGAAYRRLRHEITGPVREIA